MNLFKSKERKRIENRIRHFTGLIEVVQTEKAKVKANPKEFAKYWSIEKDYQRNINLLKELL